MREPEYGSGFQVRRIQKHGQFGWKHQRIFLSETLAGEAVGLTPIDDRYYTIYFAAFPVARLDSHKLHVEPLASRSRTITEVPENL